MHFAPAMSFRQISILAAVALLATMLAVNVARAQTGSTVADGLRTQALGVQPWAAIRRWVDGMVTVEEAAILDAVRYLARHARLVVEPSGAVTLAAVLSGAVDVTNQRVVLFISGGNVEPATLAAILAA